MAKETEEEGEIVVTEYNPHFDELLESYNNLLEDSRKVVEKYSELKVSHSKVLKAFGKMKIEKEALEEKFRLIKDEYSMTALITENKKLKATIDKLNYDLGKFVRGEENLNLILGNANDRSGLGFEVESSGTKRNKEVSIGSFDRVAGLVRLMRVRSEANAKTHLYFFYEAEYLMLRSSYPWMKSIYHANEHSF
ncbi:protein CROWDED NUCLEI 4-like [Senna tora]|uniref:Protein CROWDED NUCLEI 4-like n=1 Tax=Senna tora TaxID=362788 RepID=A0A834TM85_9FABA|nr:protein CROWDED NUCLEI 4-like [Senna tora]